MESDFTSLVWIDLLEASRITVGNLVVWPRLVETNEISSLKQDMCI